MLSVVSDVRWNDDFTVSILQTSFRATFRELKRIGIRFYKVESIFPFLLLGHIMRVCAIMELKERLICWPRFKNFARLPRIVVVLSVGENE